MYKTIQSILFSVIGSIGFDCLFSLKGETSICKLFTTAKNHIMIK